ncbi:Ribonuclease H [Gracilaria domingensis]|nr:Ribonuclease H [Gracilaria domingensis]
MFSDIVVTVDGSSLHNGQPYAVGGWGAVVSLPGATAEACRQLCDFCNPSQSNSRAEIRAVMFAQNLLREVLKMGHPVHLNADGSRCRRTAAHKHDSLDDGRPDCRESFDFVVRSDSQYVVNGIYGKINLRAHSDIWSEVFSVDRSIEENGSRISYEHVYAHNGDSENERADDLARFAACNPGHCMYRCCTCDAYFPDSDGLACHLKQLHMDRNLSAEMGQVFNYYEYNGEYCCSICYRVCDQLHGIWQHNLAKH